MNATAIMFHIRAEHKDLPLKRFSNQLYIFFLDESPSYTYEHFKVNKRPCMDTDFGSASGYIRDVSISICLADLYF